MPNSNRKPGFERTLAELVEKPPTLLLGRAFTARRTRRSNVVPRRVRPLLRGCFCGLLAIGSGVLPFRRTHTSNQWRSDIKGIPDFASRGPVVQVAVTRRSKRSAVLGGRHPRPSWNTVMPVSPTLTRTWTGPRLIQVAGCRTVYSSQGPGPEVAPVERALLPVEPSRDTREAPQHAGRSATMVRRSPHGRLYLHHAGPRFPVGCRRAG